MANIKNTGIISVKIPDDFHEKLQMYLKTVMSKDGEYDKRATFKSAIMEDIFEINYRFIQFENKRIDLYFAGVLIETKTELTAAKIEFGKEEIQRYLLKRPNTVRAVITDCVNFQIYNNLDLFKDVDLSKINPDEEFLLNDSNSDYTHFIDLLNMLYPSKSFNELDEAILVPRIKEKIIEIADSINATNQIKYKAWKNYVSIAFGSENDADEKSYKIQVALYYFTVLLTAKILQYDDSAEKILSGIAFRARGILNFIDEDNFFDFLDYQTVSIITRELDNYKFTRNSNVSAEVFRLLYEDLITPKKRHLLGEFYTPSWLAKILINSEIKTGNEDILDPSCGSGTFIRLALKKINELNGHGNVTGFDINPIAVQIARANYLMEKPDSREIPVFLGDSLMPTPDMSTEAEQALKVARGKVKKTKKRLKGVVESRTVATNLDSVREIKLDFDSIIGEGNIAIFHYDLKLKLKDITDAIDEMRKITFDKDTPEDNITYEYLSKIFMGDKSIFAENYDLIKKIRKLEMQGKDKIWFYILKNIYTPYYMKNKIDLVIGNPPWLGYHAVSGKRQPALDGIYEYYDMSTGGNNKSNVDMLEFFIARSKEFLKNSYSRIAFVATRSLFNAAQYKKIRSGKLKNMSIENKKGLFITKLWDILDMPVFNVPSCMVEFSFKDVMPSKVDGYIISGSLKKNDNRKPDITLEPDNLRIKDKEFYIYKEGIASSEIKTGNSVNPYIKRFKMGAAMKPREFFFVKIDDEYKYAYTVTTGYQNKAIRSKIKIGNMFNKDYIPKSILFNVIVSPLLSKYKLKGTEKAVLPIYILNGKIRALLNASIKKLGDQTYNFALDYNYMNSLDDMVKKIYKDYESKFNYMEKVWETHRDVNDKFDAHGKSSLTMSLYDRLEYSGGLKSQETSNNKYIVAYNASGANIKCVVIEQNEYIVDYKVVYTYIDNKNEAYYLCGVLNSEETMKKFIATGSKSNLEIDKKVFNVYFPEFDISNKNHMKIAELAEKISMDLKDGNKLSDEKNNLEDIEKLVKKIL